MSHKKKSQVRTEEAQAVTSKSWLGYLGVGLMTALVVSAGMFATRRGTESVSTDLDVVDDDLDYMGNGNMVVPEPIQYNPCKAFDPIPYLGNNPIDVDELLTVSEEDAPTTKAIVLGENHGYRHMTLECMEYILDGLEPDKQVTLAFESRKAMVPIGQAKYDYIKESDPTVLSEEILCQHDRVRECIGWDNEENIDRIVAAGKKSARAEQVAIAKTHRSRNIEMVKTIHQTIANKDSDLLIVEAGASHLRIEGLENADTTVLNLFDRLIRTKQVSHKTVKTVRFFEMPAQGNIAAELGLPTVQHEQQATIGALCTSDGPSEKRKKVKRKCHRSRV